MRMMSEADDQSLVLMDEQKSTRSAPDPFLESLPCRWVIHMKLDVVLCGV